MHRTIKNYFLITAVIIILQIVLGTLVRIYVDDISAGMNYENRELWLAALPTIFIIHRTMSWLVLAAVLFCTWKTYKIKILQKKSLWLLNITILNVLLGIILFYFEMPAVAQPLHLLMACVAIAQCAYIIFSLRAENTSS